MDSALRVGRGAGWSLRPLRLRVGVDVGDDKQLLVERNDRESLECEGEMCHVLE